MKDPRLFIVREGYELHDWSLQSRDKRNLFELSAGNCKLAMVYNEPDDIMLFRGAYHDLHDWIYNLCSCYDLVIS